MGWVCFSPACRLWTWLSWAYFIKNVPGPGPWTAHGPGPWTGPLGRGLGVPSLQPFTPKHQRRGHNPPISLCLGVYRGIGGIWGAVLAVSRLILFKRSSRAGCSNCLGLCHLNWDSWRFWVFLCPSLFGSSWWSLFCLRSLLSGGCGLFLSVCFVCGFDVEPRRGPKSQ